MEKDVISRGMIEIIEERFLGDRRSNQLTNISHEEKMKLVLSKSHPEIEEIKKRIRDDPDLTLENFPEYTAIAHDHFSSRIHQYIHNKNKIDINDVSQMSGLFPGRHLALKAVRILFNSVRTPTADHKKYVLSLFEPFLALCCQFFQESLFKG